MERKKSAIPLSALTEIDSLEDSSEDSDFRIEDQTDESNEEATSTEDSFADSEEEEIKSDDRRKKNVNNSISVKRGNAHEISTPSKKQEREEMEFSRILICCVCLGDKTNDDNEIAECDNCGVTVHEDCYGISENESKLSSDSGSSKTSWFCEACQAGQKNPTCELCPNLEGIFKETDTGKWVHLVCALYIPGVAFRDVDKLSNVTLFEMSYSKWGERACSLCFDQQFARTGVCIECDAGLCRSYFHVTCAQKEGLLSEAQFEEINHADPFYAHCKLHSNKEISKMNKRNWLAFDLQMRNLKKNDEAEKGVGVTKSTSMKTKLQTCQQKYAESKVYRGQPWVPTQKMSRPLTSCAKTLRNLSRKATLNGIDTQAMAMKEAHTNALADVHRKWHIPPAFTVEYMGYYLDRNSRICSLKQNLDLQMKENSKLVKEQREMQVLYGQAMKEYRMEQAQSDNLKTVMSKFLELIPRTNLSNKFNKLSEAFGNTSDNCSSESFMDNSKNQTLENVEHDTYKADEISDVSESLCLKCVTCRTNTDQHLLVKCDTCQMHYHLKCLDPPLTRMPKKTKVMGWQCSECDKSSSDSDVGVDRDSPRQLRHLKSSGWNFKLGSKPRSKPKIMKTDNQPLNVESLECGRPTNFASVLKQTLNNRQSNEKKKVKICRRVSTGSVNSDPLNIKQQCVKESNSSPTVNQDRSPKKGPNFCLKIEVPPAEVRPTPGYSVKESETKPGLINNPSSRTQTSKKYKIPECEILCNTCKLTGTRANIVTCDECLKGFHFHCLNPPVKKSPKGRGYSWHCADCDPSESESD